MFAKSWITTAKHCILSCKKMNHIYTWWHSHV
jgi:hypothetical protein